MIIICTSMSCSNAPHSISFNHEKKNAHSIWQKVHSPFFTLFLCNRPFALFAPFFKRKTRNKKPTATPLIDSDFPKRAEQRPYLNKLLLLHSFLHIHTKTLNRENFSCLETVSYFPLLWTICQNHKVNEITKK